MIKSQSLYLFTLQVLAHIGLVSLVIYGTWWQWMICFVVYFITGCFGMTMTYHRLLAHKSWRAPKWFEYFGTLAGFYGMTGSSIAWVAVHREHHRFSDTNYDPHSPYYRGWAWCQWLSMFHDVKVKYAANLLKSKFHVFLHQYYFLIHLAIIISFSFTDPMIMVAAYLAPAAILWNAGSAINTVNHLFGFQSHNTKDTSTNNLITGLFVWGEGWHNNHHNSPSKAQFGETWWQIDVGGYFIRLLRI